MVWKLAQSSRMPTLYCAPGNAGIESLATCVPVKADDIAGLKTFVQSEKIDLTVVGPEAPLALGIVDEFRKSKLKIFGPTKGAARIEASKVFSKEIMDSAKNPLFMRLLSAFREYGQTWQRACDRGKRREQRAEEKGRIRKWQTKCASS